MASDHSANGKAAQDYRPPVDNPRLALVFIFTTVTVDAIGIGIIIPVMPDLLIDVGSGTLAEAAIWGGILASALAVMQMLCGPLVGSLSDRFDRSC